ncbi:MAG: ATP-binding protein [Gemmatimonadota bacterium]
MKTALLAAAIDPALGGVLVLGHRGTGKSTAVRGLARILPPLRARPGCPYRCPPDDPAPCAFCRNGAGPVRRVEVPVVDLPLGTTEDRLVGTFDLERALRTGERAFEPGLLASANRGFLYVDEVNLLEDHLVDLLLDVATTGENVVEREGLSVRHPARFVLVGSGNPEEGDLRPQLLDRFGLSVEVTTPTDPDERVEVVLRRDAYDRDPEGFSRRWSRQDGRIRKRLLAARTALPGVDTPRAVVRAATELCLALGSDGLRGELTLIRAARALTAYEGRPRVEAGDLARVAPSALRHRLRRDPLDETGSTVRVERAVREILDGR